MQILLGLTGLGNLACLIMVVIKLFKQEGTMKGILGVICGLYTFIWGWINSSKLNIRNIMLIWTVLIVASIVVGNLSAQQQIAAMQTAP